jgi:hypothetical protein
MSAQKYTVYIYIFIYIYIYLFYLFLVYVFIYLFLFIHSCIHICLLYNVHTYPFFTVSSPDENRWKRLGPSPNRRRLRRPQRRRAAGDEDHSGMGAKKTNPAKINEIPAKYLLNTW